MAFLFSRVLRTAAPPPCQQPSRRPSLAPLALYFSLLHHFEELHDGHLQRRGRGEEEKRQEEAGCHVRMTYMLCWDPVGGEVGGDHFCELLTRGLRSGPVNEGEEEEEEEIPAT
eukprot:751225-Hanusia_phi.AAC.2